MNISWNSLHNWATGRWRFPAGWVLEYDSLPSGGNRIETTSIHEYWKKSPEEIRAIKDEIVKERNTTFNPSRSSGHWNFCWQQFTLTDINGKQLILRMDSKGHVTQMEKKQVTHTFEVLTPV